MDVTHAEDVALKASTTLVLVLPVDMSGASQEMIDKLIVACALDAGRDVVRVSAPRAGSLARQLASHGRRLYCVCFGLSPKQVGAHWSVNPYRWVKDSGVLYCFAERPELIVTDLDRKRQLWACMKDIKAAQAAT